MKSNKKQKVLLALSGGVDSSVAALLLKKQGYEVIGAFMKNWSNTKNEIGECLWRGERRYALKVAAMLDIPLITLDFEKEYKSQVIKKMFKDYQNGITPNPDIDCNQKIKIPLMIKAAKKLGCKYLATGHYVRIKKPRNKKGTYKLLRGKQESKDQSYFLYRTKKEELPYLLFPIGNLTKEKVRAIAKKNKFPNHDKKSTVGICFIGKIDMKKFLKHKIKPKKGKILDPKGNKIGEHDGIYYYTIGERLGPRYGFELSKTSDDKKNIKRWYVAKKNVKKNIIIAAPQGHPIHFKKEIFLKNFHLISKDKKNFKNKISKKPMKVTSRIRHVGELLPSKIFHNKKTKKIKVILKKPINGISKGQALIIYKGKTVLGGGEISF